MHTLLRICRKGASIFIQNMPSENRWEKKYEQKDEQPRKTVLAVFTRIAWR